MQQLSEMASHFLQQESARTPMHISPVIVYDQSARKGGKLRYEDIPTVFKRNLHKSVIFRRTLSGGAMGLDTPYWMEDRDFDLEFHVRHIALPKPGDWRQFCILLARLQSRGLDMKRPLWEAYVIEGLDKVEGLPEKSFALMLKIHHAAIDGISGAEIIAAIHSMSEDMTPPVVDTWKGEKEPSPWKVWSRAYVHNLQRPVNFFGTMLSLVPAIIRARKVSASPRDERRNTLAAKTRFNALISTYRVTDTLLMDLAEVKAMRKALDNVADPVERLRLVNQSAQQSNAFSNALGGSVMMDISEILIPQVLGWGFRLATIAAAQTERPMPCHVVISNVPGPQIPLYLAGAKVHLMMGMGPLLDLMGLFHAVISGAGVITINFVSCREMMPDPQFYKACLEESYQELQLAAQHATLRSESKPKHKPKAKLKSKSLRKANDTQRVARP